MDPFFYEIPSCFSFKSWTKKYNSLIYRSTRLGESSERLMRYQYLCVSKFYLLIRISTDDFLC